MRPALKQGLQPLWRGRDTVQIGIDSRRAVALTGMAESAVVIGLLDGSRDRDQVIQAAAQHGTPAETTERVLTLLAAGGVLDDFPASMLSVLPQSVRARVAPELATVSIAHRDGDGGARTLARRLGTQITIHGAGRIGDDIARILLASGIGRVGRAEPGPQPGAATPGAAGQLPDLAILVGRQIPELPARLIRERTPHLAAGADEAIGTVGPLVLPGRTACLRCLDLTRTDRDPAWPLILAQLIGRITDPLACDAPLTAAVAAQAASHALAFIDRSTGRDAAINGTLELVLPAWQWHRRTWPPHPDCTCGSHCAR